MSLGPQTQVVNGQLITSPSRSSYAPTTYGRVNATVPITSQYSVPPSVAAGQMAAPVVAAQTAAAGANPWSFTSSPVLMAIIFLAVGLVGLHAIHWHGER